MMGQSWFAIGNAGGLARACTFTNEQNARYVMATRLPHVSEQAYTYYEVECADGEWAEIIELFHAGIDPKYFGGMLHNLEPIGKA